MTSTTALVVSGVLLAVISNACGLDNGTWGVNVQLLDWIQASSTSSSLDDSSKLQLNLNFYLSPIQPGLFFYSNTDLSSRLG